MFLGRGIKPEGLNLHLQEVFREVTTPLAMRVYRGNTVRTSHRNNLCKIKPSGYNYVRGYH